MSHQWEATRLPVERSSFPQPRSTSCKSQIDLPGFSHASRDAGGSLSWDYTKSILVLHLHLPTDHRSPKIIFALNFLHLDLLLINVCNLGNRYTMATKLGLRLAPSACGLATRMPVIASRRTLSSLSKTRAPTNPSQRRTAFPRASLQHTFRRSYADGPQAVLSPPKPKRRFRIFRWLWRLTYLSALGATGWLGYQIWYLQNPSEQTEPDPTKKTLVILGRCSNCTSVACNLHPQVPVGALSPC